MSAIRTVRIVLGFAVVGFLFSAAGCSSSELSKSDQEIVAKQQEEAIKGSDAAYDQLDAKSKKR